MRFLLPCLLLASCVPAFDADACSPAPGYQRLPAFSEYDERHREWTATVGRRLAEHADPEIAWAGMVLAVSAQTVTESPHVQPVQPAPPATGLARLLRVIACESDRCPAKFDEWIAAEPDNAFVLALASQELDGEAYAAALRRSVTARRYDDYFLAARDLSAKVAALAGDPPPPPANYRPPPCSFLNGTSVGERIETATGLASLGIPDDLARDETLDTATRLHLAELFVGAIGTPSAAAAGAQLGVATADDPIDRERYCRLNERAILQNDVQVLDWLMNESDTATAGLRGRFLAALRMRNALDAVDAIAAQLPANRRPDPVDPERVAACVARRD